jgi:cytochrome c oxidase cbb3-type subunit 3
MRVNVSLMTAVVMLGCAVAIGAQAPAGRGAGQGAAGGGRGRGGPAIDPAILERGRGLYSVACASCHGSEARGGETGPNLLRSPALLDDVDGELLVPVIRLGRPDKGMPARTDLADSQLKDLATYLRSLRTSGRDPARNRPATIVVGDSAAGQAYFKQVCAKCHSTTGDLRGLATRVPEPRTLQGLWLSGAAGGGRGGGAKPVRVVVTLPSGERFEGDQVRLDDFRVSIRLADASIRTFMRQVDVPKLEFRDPLQPHRELVPTYTDRDIHNVTAYLVTLK